MVEKTSNYITTSACQVGVDMVNHILIFKLGMVKANYTEHYCPTIRYPYDISLNWEKCGLRQGCTSFLKIDTKKFWALPYKILSRGDLLSGICAALD